MHLAILTLLLPLTMALPLKPRIGSRRGAPAPVLDPMTQTAFTGSSCNPTTDQWACDKKSFLVCDSTDDKWTVQRTCDSICLQEFVTAPLCYKNSGANGGQVVASRVQDSWTTSTDTDEIWTTATATATWTDVDTWTDSETYTASEANSEWYSATATTTAEWSVPPLQTYAPPPVPQYTPPSPPVYSAPPPPVPQYTPPSPPAYTAPAGGYVPPTYNGGSKRQYTPPVP
ncbi:hypothetical protein HKX48_000195, partial [Thoreauomyces humboldtii]